MTRKDLVSKIASDTGLAQMDVKVVVDRTFLEITGSLARGERVELRNFGVFLVKSSKKRMGRNPRTGEKVSIPKRNVVRFKAGKMLKGKV